MIKQAKVTGSQKSCMFIKLENFIFPHLKIYQILQQEHYRTSQRFLLTMHDAVCSYTVHCSPFHTDSMTIYSFCLIGFMRVGDVICDPISSLHSIQQTKSGSAQGYKMFNFCTILMTRLLMLARGVGSSQKMGGQHLAIDLEILDLLLQNQ